MKSVRRLLLLLLASGVGQPSVWPAEQVYDVRDYGATPGGTTLSTAAIQKAIDACAAAGGGTVRLADALHGGTKMRSAPVPDLVGCNLHHGGLYRCYGLLPDQSADAQHHPCQPVLATLSRSRLRRGIARFSPLRAVRSTTRRRQRASRSGTTGREADAPRFPARKTSPA